MHFCTLADFFSLQSLELSIFRDIFSLRANRKLMLGILTMLIEKVLNNLLQGSSHGQRFKCAQVVNATRNEIYVQTFTQSQCYGEFHCFHAKLTPDNFVEIHVGAPTPNIEHSCVRPSFDVDIPYLLATLVPNVMEIPDNLPRQSKVERLKF